MESVFVTKPQTLGVRRHVPRFFFWKNKTMWREKRRGEKVIYWRRKAERNFCAEKEEKNSIKGFFGAFCSSEFFCRLNIFQRGARKKADRSSSILGLLWDIPQKKIVDASRVIYLNGMSICFLSFFSLLACLEVVVGARWKKGQGRAKGTMLLLVSIIIGPCKSKQEKEKGVQIEVEE